MDKRAFVLPLLVLALLTMACGVNIDINVEKGSGNVITVTREVSNFDQLQLSGVGDVTLVQGDREELTIEAEDNVIDNLRVDVQDGVLHIGFGKRSVLPTQPVRFYLTMRDIRGLNTSGAANINAETLVTDRLDIRVTGTGNMNIFDLQADSLTVTISGAGNFDALGEVSQLRINLSGAGNFNGQELRSQSADVNITGLGRVVVWPSDSLNVLISGTGSVDYYGSPQVTQQISGLGKLNQKGIK